MSRIFPCFTKCSPFFFTLPPFSHPLPILFFPLLVFFFSYFFVPCLPVRRLPLPPLTLFHLFILAAFSVQLTSLSSIRILRSLSSPAGNAPRNEISFLFYLLFSLSLFLYFYFYGEKNHPCIHILPVYVDITWVFSNPLLLTIHWHLDPRTGFIYYIHMCFLFLRSWEINQNDRVHQNNIFKSSVLLIKCETQRMKTVEKFAEMSVLINSLIKWTSDWVS